jgi:methionine synthase I (cobalamin-dependent)
MIALHQQAGIKILGGCCGTRVEHLRYLTDHLGSHGNSRG